MLPTSSILPVLGSAFVWRPGVVVLPLVYRRVSNMHPMATLVGAFVGVTAR